MQCKCSAQYLFTCLTNGAALRTKKWHITQIWVAKSSLCDRFSMKKSFVLNNCQWNNRKIGGFLRLTSFGWLVIGLSIMFCYMFHIYIFFVCVCVHFRRNTPLIHEWFLLFYHLGKMVCIFTDRWKETYGFFHNILKIYRIFSLGAFISLVDGFILFKHKNHPLTSWVKRRKAKSEKNETHRWKKK